MGDIPTVTIKGQDGGPLIINESDFDESLHELWAAKAPKTVKASESPQPDLPEPPLETAPAPVESVGARLRRERAEKSTAGKAGGP